MILCIIKMIFYICIAVLVVVTYLAYALFVKPMQMKAFYTKLFRR
jgi:hypothetical protein